MTRLFPVVHVESGIQARKEVEVARHAGADGAFLINHAIDGDYLWDIFQTCRVDHPSFWLGVNFLDLSLLDAMAWVCTTDVRVDALWADKSGIDDNGASRVAERAWEIKQQSGWAGEYFGGVAFKGQKPVFNWEGAAWVASQHMDVVTTSGPATGQAAPLDKIKRMYKGTAEHGGAERLAIASGITVENAPDYLGLADAFLVATGISRSFTELDPAKVKALADLCHA